MSEKILRRIQAFMDQANHPNTEPVEAEKFMNKATELMAKYQIDDMMLTAAAPERDTIGKSDIPVSNPFSTEKAALVGAIADVLGCKGVQWRRSKSMYKVTVVGFGRDRERVEFLYTLLLLQAQRGVARVESTGWATETRRRRASYLKGFADEAGRRLARVTRAAVQEAPAAASGVSAALVIVDRQDQVEMAYREFFPKLGKATSRRYDSASYAAGTNDARRADLGQDRMGADRLELR